VSTELQEPAGRSRFSALLDLAWPVVLARATQGVIGFSDAVLIAPLGEEPLAAVTTGALNALALLSLPMGTVYIVQSFAAQLRGRGETAAAVRYGWYGLSIAAVAGIVSLLAIPGIGAVLGLFRYSPGVEHLMTTYLSIRLLSVAPAAATEALGSWYGGLGNTRMAMIAGVVAMTTNIALCYALIEPRFGLPGYGVAGAAWANVISTVLGLMVVLVPFLRGWGYTRTAERLGLRWSELLRVLRFGLPSGANWFLEFAAFMLFINIVIAHLGTTTLAAFNVVMQINSIVFMPAFGLASAGAILVGEALGRRKPDEVWPIVRLTASVAATWMVSIALVYAILPGPLVGLFRPRGVPAEALMKTATVMLVLSSFWQLFDAIAITLSEALRAAGDTAWCMAARIVLAWVVFTPVAWTLVLLFDGGILTVMVTLIAYLFVLSAAFALRFAGGRWRRIDLVGSEPTLV
jgi:multidrug resistance protein, MATE family